MSVLESIYYEKRGATGDSLFYVPECFRNDFLKENHAFTAKMGNLQSSINVESWFPGTYHVAYAVDLMEA